MKNEEYSASENNQIDFIRSCKGLLNEDGCGKAFNVFTETGIKIGTMRTIDSLMANDPGLIEQMTTWRRNFAGNFLTEFEVTNERTHNWLKLRVLPADDRLLFILEDLNQSRIGQFGIAGVREKIMDLDNGIRGEAGGHSRLFYYVELMVLRLGFYKLKIHEAHVGVFRDNFLARRLHKSVGFVEIDSSQVVRQKFADGRVQYVPCSGSEAPTREYLTLSINKDTFEALHPWINDVEE